MNEKLIAYYLPQFHPIPENDEWWGKGFTEWTNVGRATKLFKDHYQPRVPADLGYYDLRLIEVIEAQADLALKAGIYGFCYWHYWFAGKKLLNSPFEKLLKAKNINMPFSLAWANETWTGVWNNNPKRILIEQQYPGKEDYVAHFYNNLDAFIDERYIRIDDRLLFVVYKPFNIPDPNEFFDTWNNLAVKNGLRGFYFVGVSFKPLAESDSILKMGFDAVNSYRISDAQTKISKFGKLYKGISRRFFNGNLQLTKYEYKDIISNWIHTDDYKENIIPTLLPNWDNSPRSGKNAIILHNSTPEYFETHLKHLLKVVENKKNKILFLKSWNEWAEGNYVEPDLKYGTQYLEALKKNLKD